MIRKKAKEGGNLYTEKEYSDFIFRFEFQLTPGANNGLGIHAPLEGDAAYVGKELQILDNTAENTQNSSPINIMDRSMGSSLPSEAISSLLGMWNQQEVRVQGSNIQVILNGTTIVDGDMLEASKEGTLDGKDHPGLQRDSGHIGFLGHGDVLRFREHQHQRTIKILIIHETGTRIYNRSKGLVKGKLFQTKMDN